MSPADARLVRLAAEVERDWAAVELHCVRAGSVDPAASAPNAAFVALALHHAYEALETLLLRLERSLGLPPRTGSDWHAGLLTDATVALGARPALIPSEAAPDWLEVLRFRHFLRHAYVAELDPVKLHENRQRLQQAVQRTAASVHALVAHLRA